MGETYGFARQTNLSSNRLFRGLRNRHLLPCTGIAGTGRHLRFKRLYRAPPQNPTSSQNLSMSPCTKACTTPKKPPPEPPNTSNKKPAKKPPPRMRIYPANHNAVRSTHDESSLFLKNYIQILRITSAQNRDCFFVWLIAGCIDVNRMLTAIKANPMLRPLGCR